VSSTASDGFKSIPAMAAAAAKRFGDRAAIVDGETRLSHAQLFDAARSFAAALVESGIRPGDRVAIWTFNSAEWVIAALGIFQSGATLVPINTRFKGVEAADILRRSRTRVLITVTDFLGNDYVAMLRGAGIGLPDLETVVVAGGEAGNDTSWQEFLSRADADSLAEVDLRSAAVGPDDPSDILFTSGTTGTPKGVVMTHGRTLCVATDWVAMTGLNADDRYLMVNPYFHMFGLKAGILACLASGAAMLPEPVFDVDRVLRRVVAERVTVLPGPPTLYQSILDHPERAGLDLSSLRIAVTGAADIPVELVRRVHDELPFSMLVSGYGLTEAGTASGTSPDDAVETVATTVGRARPGFEIRIVDDPDQPGGHDAPAGQPGEIWLRGASVMSHYLDDPEATAATLSAEGWLRTGDLGICERDGLLRIVGRTKDMFIVGGFNVYPAEIENFLRRHPDVKDAAVIGIAEPRLGEVGMAFVVTGPGSSVTGADIVAWCRDQMANYKAPRVIEILDALPLNATGKVAKQELRARAAKG
jgi:acyl-CoA synthetase (AMP-forming)/AMP-acid ligase II